MIKLVIHQTYLSGPAGTYWPKGILPKEVLFQKLSNSNLILANSYTYMLKHPFN